VLVKYGMVEDGMKELCGCVDCAEPKREVQCSARFCPHHGNQKPGRSWRVRGVGDDVYRREREWEEVTGGKGSIDENDNDYGSAVLAAATERKYESKMCVPTDQGLRRALRNTWPLTKKLNGRGLPQGFWQRVLEPRCNLGVFAAEKGSKGELQDQVQAHRARGQRAPDTAQPCARVLVQPGGVQAAQGRLVCAGEEVR
jgi:hypothetical protein